MGWKDDHPEWKELQCDGCKQVARGTEIELEDWIPRHERVTGHKVRPRK